MLREDLERRESAGLSPYAMLSAQSVGRRYPEEPAPYRTCFQRDRDRIIHSKAFRRLEYKTQVFLNHEGDHYRTRLTHTMEVTQIGRTIARALGLNEDLTEAIALAHDLGHTPFGHSGEEALRELMADHGGFEHNEHGLRVVDQLESQYPAFPGLNLSYEVRESIIKHSTRWDSPRDEGFRPGPALLEAQVVEAADSIAYDNHDLQDGLEAEILTHEALGRLKLWDQAVDAARSAWGQLDGEQLCGQATRYLINLFVTDVVDQSRERLAAAEISSWEDAAEQAGNVIGFSEGLAAAKEALETLLFDVLYRDHRVVRLTNSAKRFVRDIFNSYVDDPRQLPPQHYAWAQECGLHRAVCDYIAGMTDRFAQDQYVLLFHPYQRL
jgi:dGTPase